MVATNVEYLSVLNQAPDLGLFQVVQAVVVGGSQVGAHAAVVAGDDDAAAARGLRGLDAVLDAQAGLLARVLEDGGVLVVADAAQVHDAVGRQHVLRAARRVLRRAARDERRARAEQLLVQPLVLVLG